MQRVRPIIRCRPHCKAPEGVQQDREEASASLQRNGRTSRVRCAQGLPAGRSESCERAKEEEAEQVATRARDVCCQPPCSQSRSRRSSANGSIRARPVACPMPTLWQKVQRRGSQAPHSNLHNPQNKVCLIFLPSVFIPHNVRFRPVAGSKAAAASSSPSRSPAVGGRGGSLAPAATMPALSPQKASPKPAAGRSRMSEPSREQCPHCGRQFEHSAFLRHVDICQKVQNKPKRR